MVLNFGSAVMGPEVYLKALAIAHFTTAVFDLIDLPDDYHSEASRHDPRYSYRPFKTILVRTVRDLRASFYVRGDHRETIPNLRARLVARQGDRGQ